MVDRYDGWLQLASHLRLPLRECLEKISNREYRIWREWFRQQLSTPDKHDWYLMQVACEVRRVLAKKPSDYQIDDFKIAFQTSHEAKAPTEGGLTAEQVANIKTEMSKQAWAARLGMTRVQLEQRLKQGSSHG